MSDLTKADLDAYLELLNKKNGDGLKLRKDGFGFPMFEASEFKIFESTFVPPYAKKEIEVPRTWRERLFSRPWRPWVKTKKIEVDDLDAPVLWRMGSFIMCHPIVKENYVSLLASS